MGAGSKPALTIRSQESSAHNEGTDRRPLAARNAARLRPRCGLSAHSSRLFSRSSRLLGRMKTLKTPT